MKRISMLFLSVGLISLTAFAQRPSGGGQSTAERADKRVQELNSRVTLTPAQSTQINQVFTDAFKKMEALPTTGDRSQQQTARQEIMRDARRKVQALLTDEQQKKLRNSARQQERSQQRPGGKG